MLLPYNNSTSERFGESILSSNTALRIMGQGYRFFILGWLLLCYGVKMNISKELKIIEMDINFASPTQLIRAYYLFFKFSFKI